MDLSKEIDIIVDMERKSLNLNSVVIVSTIMLLFKLVTLNIRTKLMNTLRYKWLKAKNRNLPKKVLKSQIEQGESRKLLVDQAIPYLNP